MKKLILPFLLLISTIGFANKPENLARILKSGDGKSPETAYEVYSINEEYLLLKYMEDKPNQQMLQYVNEKLYDVFQVNGKLVWFTKVKKPDYIIIS